MVPVVEALVPEVIDAPAVAFQPRKVWPVHVPAASVSAVADGTTVGLDPLAYDWPLKAMGPQEEGWAFNVTFAMGA